MTSEVGSTEPRAHFAPAQRMNTSLTASRETRILRWLANRLPSWITSDQLTALGFAAQLGAGIAFTISRFHRWALLAVVLCILLNWLGDSLDGTLARVRGHGRPRYGFYVDHMSDALGAVALMGGLGCSGYLHWTTAVAMLIAFLLLACESYLATYTLSRFELSQGLFGPTEIRLALIAGTLALLRSPYSHVFGRQLLLFDLGGWIAIAGMAVMLILVTLRHTVQLYREEPLP